MLRRKDSFFGLHFDFHASPGCPPIGSTLREDELREICRLLRPDFLQTDCKGHPGWASYPTQCGNAMPEFAFDTLELWRRVTREENVALYTHYSGVVDARYCADHPSETVTRADGRRADQATRTCGAYADELLIPQLCELAGKYGVDGVWVDGDCWGTEADFSPDTLAAFEKKLGIKLDGLPSERGKPYFDEFRDFCRELYRDYLRRFVNGVHEKYPDFQICSNWAFTDHMPEPVCADVDFISGDLNPGNSFNSARYAARAIARQGKPWDLMSWNFRWGKGEPKHPVQLMQEAAAVISLGGGFQNYITQYRDGSPRMDQIRRMKPLADFVRARQPFCQGVTPLPQAAVLLSTYDRHLESGSLFSRTGMDKIMGAVCLACDCGHSTEIVGEHTLFAPDAPKVVIVPELYSGLAPETVALLLDYVRGGGSLLLAGKKTVALFEGAGAPFSLSKEDENVFFTLDGEDFGRLDGVREISGGTPMAWLCSDPRAERRPFAASARFGRGVIAAVGADIGGSYASGSQYLLRSLAERLLAGLYSPDAVIESARGRLELTLTQRDGRRFVQLVNAGGNHACASCLTDDYIPPVNEVRLSVRCESRPSAIFLQPEGRELPFEWDGGRARFFVGEVALHEIVEIIP